MRTDYIVNKLYGSFVLVSILSALSATLGMLIDNVIVGQFFGETGLGVMSLVGPMSLIFSACGNISSGGGTALAAQALGRSDTERLQSIFSQAVYFVLIVGAVLTAAGLLFTEPIARMLGASDELVAPTVEYLQGYFWGAIPTMLTTTMTAFVKIDGSPQLPLITIGVMSVVNVVLDLVMVTVFHLGLFGMALATTIAYCCALAVALTHFRRPHASLHLVKPPRHGRDIGSMIYTGAPTALSRICDTVQVTVLNNMLAVAIGTAALAAFNVRTTASNLFGAFILGLAQASVPIVGMFYGEEDREALASVLRAAFRRGLVINLIVAALLFFLAPVLPEMLGLAGTESFEMAATAVRFFAVGMPFSLIVNVLISFYQGSERVGMAALICVLERLALILLFAALLLPVMSALGVWLSFVLADVATILIVLIVTSVRLGRFPRHLSDYVIVAESFGGDPHDRLDLSIGNDMSDVVRIAEGIHKFGRSRDIDQRTLDVLSLSIEEMAGNVVKHAFKPGERRWLDVCILDKPDRIKVRLRDNGAPFHPVEHLVAQADKGSDEIGIRLVNGMADSMTYTRTMGLLNNLNIEILKTRTKPYGTAEESA